MHSFFHWLCRLCLISFRFLLHSVIFGDQSDHVLIIFFRFSRLCDVLFFHRFFLFLYDRLKIFYNEFRIGTGLALHLALLNDIFRKRSLRQRNICCHRFFSVIFHNASVSVPMMRINPDFLGRFVYALIYIFILIFDAVRFRLFLCLRLFHGFFGFFLFLRLFFGFFRFFRFFRFFLLLRLFFRFFLRLRLFFGLFGFFRLFPCVFLRFHEFSGLRRFFNSGRFGYFRLNRLFSLSGYFRLNRLFFSRTVYSTENLRHTFGKLCLYVLSIIYGIIFFLYLIFFLRFRFLNFLMFNIRFAVIFRHDRAVFHTGRAVFFHHIKLGLL